MRRLNTIVNWGGLPSSGQKVQVCDPEFRRYAPRRGRRNRR